MRYWSSPPLADMAGAHALLADIRRHFEAKTLFQWGLARLEQDAHPSQIHPDPRMAVVRDILPTPL